MRLYIHFNSREWHKENVQEKWNKAKGRESTSVTASLTADERKSFEVDVVLFLQWLRLNTDACAEQHIHHFNDTFSGRSPAQAEINSTLVPGVCAKPRSLAHTQINAQFCSHTKTCRCCGYVKAMFFMASTSLFHLGNKKHASLETVASFNSSDSFTGGVWDS